MTTLQEILKSAKFNTHLKTKDGHHVIITFKTNNVIGGVMNLSKYNDADGECSEIYRWTIEDGKWKNYYRVDDRNDIIGVWDEEPTFYQKDIEESYNKGINDGISQTKNKLKSIINNL